MTVYIDQANIPFGRMIMCHMVSDSIEELHEMAAKIGVARRHFQNHPRHPHYDICLAKKKLAIKNGAVELSNLQMCYFSDLRHTLEGQKVDLLVYDDLKAGVPSIEDFKEIAGKIGNRMGPLPFMRNP